MKNWEKEASHKTEINQWRTVDPEQYTFATNGGPKSSAADMVKIGTYNALIGESEYYASSKLNFDLSHKVFRQALGTGFAWEVLEVYSGPPTVVFKWRHVSIFPRDLKGGAAGCDSYCKYAPKFGQVRLQSGPVHFGAIGIER